MPDTQPRQRMRHRLTAHHLRRQIGARLTRGNILAICSCGWEARWFRRLRS